MAGDGYAKMHAVDVQARADMLESVAGLDEAGMEREIAFGLAAVDARDAATMRWVVCLLARRVAELDGQEFVGAMPV